MFRGVNRVRDRDGVRYRVRDGLRYMYIGLGMGLGLVVFVLFFLRNTPPLQKVENYLVRKN